MPVSMISWSERGRRLITKAILWLPLALPLYLIRFRIGPVPTTFLELILLVILVKFTFLAGVEGWKKGWHRAAGWRPLLLIWAIVTFFAVCISPHVWAGLGLWRAYILEPLLIFIVLQATVVTEEQKRQVERAFLFVVIPLVVWAVVQFFTGNGIPHPWDVSIAAGRRATGPYPFPNALALFLAPITAYAFARWMSEPRKKFPLFIFALGTIGILLARSDGGLIATLCVVALCLLGARWGRRLLVVTVSAGILLFAISSSIRTVLWHELTFQGWSGRVRVWMWQETWQMLKDQWFTGAGFGGYPTVIDPYHKKRFIEIFQYPHTIVFNFWSETGLLGLLAFGAIVGKWIKERIATWRAYGYTQAMIFLAPLIAILVHGLVDVPYFKNDLALAFWIFAFLAMRTFQNQEETKRGK